MCASPLCPSSPHPSIHLPFLLSLSSLHLSLPLFLSLLPRTTDIAIRVPLLLSVSVSLSLSPSLPLHAWPQSATTPPFLNTALPGLLNARRKAHGAKRDPQPAAHSVCALKRAWGRCVCVRCARAYACYSWLDGWVDKDRTAGGFCTLFRHPSGVFGGGFIFGVVAGLFGFFAIVSNRLAEKDGG
jgi:hypothetical protein